ncbi:MAG: DUF4097 domain-containing protein [Acidobacteriota bacterium]|nr:DUF4097 domain-containing protein [Acidobacteriota bacterium]
MKINIKIIFAVACVYLSAAAAFSFSQTAPSSTPLVKRTTYKSEKISFGAGGTVTIVGAPLGSITVEGWQKNEIEVQAEIEIEAATEADLAQLAQVNGFVLDEDFGHARIVSVGTHDRDYMKRAAKKFPKHLLSVPFKIDFRIKVPIYCDLEINGGKGDLTLSAVEGAMLIKFLESNAKMDLVGGAIDATFGSGKVDVKIAKPSWRGRMLNVGLATGTLNVRFPQNLSADLDASILKNGKIESSLENLKPRDRAKFSEKSIVARAGNGGALLSFTVGDGGLNLSSW